MAQALPVATDCCTPCESCAITISTSDSLGGVLVAKSLAEGRAFSSANAAVAEFLVINGTMTGGDGFLGVFTWDPFSAAVDDAASVLKPDDNPILGRWIRQV